MHWSNIMATGALEATEKILSFRSNQLRMGSKLFPSDAIKAKDWAKITHTCKNTLSIINKIKK